MKRFICAAMAAIMLVLMTACGESKTESAKTAVVPFVYEQDGKTMLMDAESGTTRTLSDDTDVYKAVVMISRDNRTVYYMDHVSDNTNTGTLYTIKGDIMTSVPTVIAENVSVYTSSVDGSVVAYVQDDALFRVVDGGKPECLSDTVQLMAFLGESNTLQYCVEDESNMVGDNVMYCHEDGTIEKTQTVEKEFGVLENPESLLDSSVWHERFEKEWTISEKGLLSVEGKIVDDSVLPLNDDVVSETLDTLLYVTDVTDDEMMKKGTLRMYRKDGTVETVCDRVYALPSVKSHIYFLSDGSFVYMIHEGNRQFSVHRYVNGEDTVLFDASTGVKRYCSNEQARGSVSHFMRSQLNR